MAGTSRRSLRKERSAKLDEMRLDYAWKWFSFHAEQRTKMFNYMLLGLGLFATVIVTAVKERLFVEAAMLSLAAAALALGFSFIDRRNRRLYEVAMHVLYDIERTQLFADKKEYYPLADAGEDGAKSVPYAISWRIYVEDKDLKDEPHFATLRGGRHRFWMPLIIRGLAIFFFVAALWMFWQAVTAGPQRTASDEEAKPFLVCCNASCATCATSVPPASERIGRFESGSDLLDCKSEATRSAVESIRARVVEALALNQHVVVFLVGGTDRDPLSPPLRTRFGSNSGLARARVSAVETCLALGALPKGTADRVAIIRMITGPSYTPPTPGGPQADRAGKAADRAVSVYLQSASEGRP